MEQRTPKPGRFGLVPKRSRPIEPTGAAPARAGAIRGGRGGAPMWVRIRSMGAASVTQATRR